MKFNLEAPLNNIEKTNKINSKEDTLLDVLPDSLDVSVKPSETFNQLQENNLNVKFLKKPLTLEEQKLSSQELAKVLNVQLYIAKYIKKMGYISSPNPEYVPIHASAKEAKIKREKGVKYLEEITPIQIFSFESAIGNSKEQEAIKDAINVFRNITHRQLLNKDINKKKFKLLNGTEVFISDLVILKRLIEARAYRNKDGMLVIHNKDKNEFDQFTLSHLIEKYEGLLPRNSAKKYSHVQSLMGIKQRAPNLFKFGILKDEDFGKRNAGSSSYEIMGPHERTITASKPDVYFSNKDIASKYFLGREKFVGTDKKINHDTVRVSLLDNQTAAITDTIHGKKVILYTFPLITREEYEIKKRKIEEKITEEGKEIKSRINDLISIGGKEMKTRLHSYTITDYIKKKNKETEIEYAKRISQLSDTSYTFGKFRSFISETGTAANNYSWHDQLILADALTNVTEKEKIIELGKKFGRDGIRAFLSLENNKNLGNKIIDIANNPNKEGVAQKIFAKYGEIVDSVEKTEQEIKNLYKNENILNHIFESIKEILLKKGVELLSVLADNSKERNKINENKILSTLEDIKISTIIMGASYIELYKQNIQVPIEDIANTTLDKAFAQNLSDEDKKELLKVYKNGRPRETYENEEHIKLLIEEFEATLNNKDTFIFNIRFKGEIIAFATFHKENEDTLHIGGLTFIEDVRNPAIGYAVMNSIMKEFGDFNIRALVHSENEVRKMYQKRFGFKIIKELPREENAGELYYEIERPKNTQEGRIVNSGEDFQQAA